MPVMKDYSEVNVATSVECDLVGSIPRGQLDLLVILLENGSSSVARRPGLANPN